MKIKLLLIATVFCNFYAVAQKSQFLKIPKITEEDVKSTRSSLKDDVPVEILYNSYHYRIDYRGVMYIDVINRIKIYNKDKAGDYLDKEISVYSGKNGTEKLLSLKALTYNFENGKIKETTVEKDSKFKSVEDKNYDITKFAFPEVKNGSLLEYTYSIETPFYYAMPKIMVQREIPVKYFEYVLETPVQLGYTINYTGTLKPTYREVENREIYGGLHTSYNYGYVNIEAYKNEDFVGNNDNLKTSIKPEINSTMISNDFQRYTLTWEDVRKKLYENEDFGAQLRKTSMVKNILPESIHKMSDPEAKIQAILQFVQKNYKWNNESNLLANDGIRNLLNTKVGNSAEINLLLILLLKNAGIEANPVVLSTVGRGMLNYSYPSLAQLNYVIAAVKTQSETALYDATNDYSSKNTLPPRALNQNGLLMTEKEFKQISINYPGKSETVLAVETQLNADGTFSGTFSDTDTNLFAMMAHENYDENKEKYQKTYTEKYNFPIQNIKSESNGNNSFQTSFNFTSDSFVDAIGSKLVFNPLLFLYTKNHSFNQEEERKAPLEFYSAYTRTKKVTITIPEGFVFENVPASKRFRTDDNAISYLYLVTQANNKLTIETTTVLDADTYPKEYYPAFKQIFDNITKLEGQVVTVVKK